MPKIGIINVGISNLTSVQNAVRFLGFDLQIIETPLDCQSCSHLVLPGVGTFQHGIRSLRERGLDAAVIQYAKNGVPILGICLGMQLLGSEGEEFGPSRGLDLIQGTVKRIDNTASQVRLPHIGWNEITITGQSRLFSGIDDKTSFYFLHSYSFTGIADDKVIARCDYGLPLVAAVQCQNVLGVQFHPEKSQKAGLQLIRNFATLC